MCHFFSLFDHAPPAVVTTWPPSESSVQAPHPLLLASVCRNLVTGGTISGLGQVCASSTHHCINANIRGENFIRLSRSSSSFSNQKFLTASRGCFLMFPASTPSIHDSVVPRNRITCLIVGVPCKGIALSFNFSRLESQIETCISLESMTKPKCSIFCTGVMVDFSVLTHNPSEANNDNVASTAFLHSTKVLPHRNRSSR